MTLLLACLLAATFMAGLSWFVGLVHYPLFASVGTAEWAPYHRLHSARTTLVVVLPMVVELVTAAVLALDPPERVDRTSATVGLALAAGTWILTAWAAQLHGRLGDQLDRSRHRTLLAVHHARTALWTAHALLLATLVASAAG